MYMDRCSQDVRFNEAKNNIRFTKHSTSNIIFTFLKSFRNEIRSNLYVISIVLSSKRRKTNSMEITLEDRLQTPQCSMKEINVFLCFFFSIVFFFS